MKVLIYGGGAREHALAWKITQSPLLTKLYLSKPNDGFAELGEVIDTNNFQELAQISKEKEIDLLIVGPEQPLIEGITDVFKNAGINVLGADKKWAMLEGSKSFAKNFMDKNNIPTAKYKAITELSEAEKCIDDIKLPIVIKADGLAAGKGVFIAETKEQAKETIQEFLNGKFGEASKKIIAEEFLEGKEISVISLWDGKTLVPFVPACDYKKLLDENKGPNTGGMGAYCPSSLTLQEYIELEEYNDKLKAALVREKADFTGVIYSGLILTKDGIKTLEYNMRFGDPETQALLLHLESDLLEIFSKTVNKKLNEVKLSWKEGQSFCVVVAAKGYPENPITGTEINNLPVTNNVDIFFAGVKKENGQLLSNGGRILSVCKTGIGVQKDIYDEINQIEFTDKIYRKDIGEVSLFGKESCNKDKDSSGCSSCNCSKDK